MKTRLSPLLSYEDAARLYEAFLGDALEAYTTEGAFLVAELVTVRLYLAGSDSLPKDLLPDGASVHHQKGDGLGSRMLHAFLETFAAGFERVVIVGTDHPTLPLEYINEAFRALDEPFSVVLGPSDDGGYYLLGLNEFYPALFEMEYSHAAVFSDTLMRVEEIGASPVILPMWYDVDDGEGLHRLVNDWRAGVPFPSRTGSALKALLEAHPNLL